MIHGHDNSLVVLDGLMSQCSNDTRVSDLFTRDSHHLGMSVLYLTQNLFPPGERSRSVRTATFSSCLETHAICLVFNSTFASQMFPKHTEYLLDAFHDATSEPYEYLSLVSIRSLAVVTCLSGSLE